MDGETAGGQHIEDHDALRYYLALPGRYPREGRSHAAISSRRKCFLGLWIAAAVVAFCFWSGCASTVKAPASVKDPVTVRLMSTGRHAGLLLPCPDGRVVEYGYGDWGWYALLKNEWWRAPATVVWPNQGTLGRRYIRSEDLDAMGDTYGFAHLSKLVVSGEKTGELVARLDARFAAGGEPHYNEAYDMWFVKYPSRFWFVHDCHDEVAEWLRELGCSVSPAPIRVRLRLEKAEG